MSDTYLGVWKKARAKRIEGEIWIIATLVVGVLASWGVPWLVVTLITPLQAIPWLDTLLAIAITTIILLLLGFILRGMNDKMSELRSRHRITEVDLQKARLDGANAMVSEG